MAFDDDHHHLDEDNFQLLLSGTLMLTTTMPTVMTTMMVMVMVVAVAVVDKQAIRNAPGTYGSTAPGGCPPASALGCTVAAPALQSPPAHSITRTHSDTGRAYLQQNGRLAQPAKPI